MDEMQDTVVPWQIQEMEEQCHLMIRLKKFW